MRRSTLAVGVAVLALMACKGPEGPMGPQGPAGPQGPPGAPAPLGATQYTATGTVAADSSAVVTMPGPVAGSQDLPTLACYISQDRVTWLSVSFDSASGLACGMNKNSAGMNVVMVGAPPGWYYYFALTYVPAS